MRQMRAELGLEDADPDQDIDADYAKQREALLNSAIEAIDGLIKMNSGKKPEHDDLPTVVIEKIDETTVESAPEAEKEDQETPDTHRLASYYNVLQSKIDVQKQSLAANVKRASEVAQKLYD